MEVLVISGPAGVGKSTVAYELSRRLELRDIAHALIDTDELDRIYPAPPQLSRMTEESLSAVWAVLHRHRAPRLILVGVYLDLLQEREWIGRALPNADVTYVRLMGSPLTLTTRIRRREVGSGATDQIARTMRQLSEFATLTTQHPVVTLSTDRRTPIQIAAQLELLWPPRA